MANGLILNGLKGEERKRMEMAVGNAAAVFKRISELIEQELKEDDIPSFDNPNWACAMAFKEGYRKGLTKILKYVIIRDK